MFLGTIADAVQAEDVSTAPILQLFETKWETIDDRMADIFVSGYGRMWVPPPQRADSGGVSVGYDVFDRFDLGSARNETLYGTEEGLKKFIRSAHQANVLVNTDFILNHNGFSDSSTFDNQGTPNDPSDDVYWADSGGYPGFVTELPGLIDGDFHSAFESSEETFRLAGLIDINQSLNNQFIRTPVEVGNPANIPAGTQGIFGRGPVNVPDPNNARFYPDQDLGGTTVFDPRLNQNVTLYDFNTTTPLSGDAISENALGLMLRNARWMIQEVGVDGFRLDAARHFPRWVLDYFDQATFLADKGTLLDGSPKHQYSFIETGGDGSLDFLQEFIRKDIDNNNLSQVGGNRDALDFNLFFSLRQNLSDNGLVNDWRNIKNSSIDVKDDGFANNGSQGVGFGRSHDDGPSHLDNVAQAYLMMRPGNALVYMNGKQFGEGRPFPRDGREDALGGLNGEVITTLVNIRNTHGRGNYRDRTPSVNEKELLIYERENSALVVLNNRGDSGYDEITVQTSFAPGTPLIELTGNAENSFIDPNDDLPSVLIVKGDGTVDIRSPRNKSSFTDPVEGLVENDHRSGYLIYGVSGPQGDMRLTNTAGQDLSVLAGSTPVAGQGGMNGPSDNFYNGNTRLADISVVTDNTFKLRIETNAVNLLGTIRDADADGDYGQFKIDGGVDANSNGFVDSVTPGSVDYGFEEFTEIMNPGFGSVDGNGLYEQTIDATQLSEGRHYLTGRVYRHRNAATGGDGGPAVFTDFREVVYVDLLPPEVELVSFEPFESDPSTLNNRDFIAKSSDGTANAMHFFLAEPASVSNTELTQRALNGEDVAGEYDADQWVRGYTNLPSGNHVVSVVTFEPTGNSSVTRFVGLIVSGTRGAGVGDLDWNNVFNVNDIIGFRGIEKSIENADINFNPAADITADGLINTNDLLAMGQILLDESVGSVVLDEYASALIRHADLDDSGTTNSADLELLYTEVGTSSTEYDLNHDGIVNGADAQLLVLELVRTMPGDYNLDGTVNAADYTVWRDSLGNGNLVADGDFDGDVDADDYQMWATSYGFVRSGISSSSFLQSSVSVPEPTSLMLLATFTLCFGTRRKRLAAYA